MKNNHFLIVFFAVLGIFVTGNSYGQTSDPTQNPQPGQQPVQGTDPPYTPPPEVYFAVFGGPCPADMAAKDPCSCTGLCSMDTMHTVVKQVDIIQGNQSSSYAANAIKVKVGLLKKDHSVLVISFKTADLKQKQPKQCEYMANSKEYKFGATFSLDSHMFWKLGVPAHAMITPNDQCLVEYDKKGITSIYCKYSVGKSKMLKKKK